MFWNLMSLWRISVGKELKENFMCIKVYEKLGEKNGSCKLCLMCQKEKKIEKRHEKKSERKEKWKERKIQSKECVCCGKNRSIDENEGKMGQKHYICPYFWICSTSFIDSLWNPLSFLVEPTYLQPHYNLLKDLMIHW